MTNELHVAVIYYSATGMVHELAEALGEGARKVGADVRVHRVQYAAGGNPYGVSWPTGMPPQSPDALTLEAARYQGQRLAEVARRLMP